MIISTKRLILTCLLVWLAVTPATAVAQIEHQLCFVGECNAMTTEFRDLTLRPKHIAVLPPFATLHQKNILSTDEKLAQARPLEDALGADLKKQLERQGYEVRLLSEAELDADAQLSELVVKANKRYDEELDRMVASELKGVKYRRYTLGNEGRALANYLDVDAVAFGRFDAVGASAGQRLIGFGNQGQLHLGVSIAHARTGDIEAFFGASNTPAFGKSVEGIIKKPGKTTAKISKTAFKKLPNVTQALNAEKLDTDEIRPVQLYEREDEETLLDDLEEMLAEPAEEAADS